MFANIGLLFSKARKGRVMSLYNKIIDLQKLRLAWKRVRANRPASGADRVSWGDFEARLDKELKDLHVQLEEHRYKCQPVKIISLFKNGKERPIALYAMRDKVVQQSVADEIYRIFEKYFSSRTYAYRREKSALGAVQDVEKTIRAGKYPWVLKTDIHQFFENIQWEVLEKTLRMAVREDEVLLLIRDISQAHALRADGTYEEKSVGLYQGSSISPVLSNIYLLQFDQWLAAQSVFFVRYSDDMLILGESKEILQKVLEQIKDRLAPLGLTISEEKTLIAELSNGIDFLGYRFDDKGKAVSSKARGALAMRLEEAWLANSQMPCAERLDKLAGIIGGWEQYYKEKDVGDILEYAVAFEGEKDPESRRRLALVRPLLDNPYQDLAAYFIKNWKELEEWGLLLWEYEELYRIRALPSVDISASDLISPEKAISLVRLYDKLSEAGTDTEAVFMEIMQQYADLGEYERAEAVQARILEEEERQSSFPQKTYSPGRDEYNLSEYKALTPEEVEGFWGLFSGREDMYALVDISEGKKRILLQKQPLTLEVAARHLRGDSIVATYVQRPNRTAKYFLIDVDISRRIMLQCKAGDEVFEQSRQSAAACTLALGRCLARRGLQGCFEYSGLRGYHIWIFLDGWLPCKYLNLLQDIIEQEVAMAMYEDLTLEFFPNKARLKPDSPGQCVKLPLCTIDKEGRASVLLNASLTLPMKPGEWMGQVKKATLDDIKRAISFGPQKQSLDASMSDQAPKVACPPSDVACLGKLEAGISAILVNCSLMRYLCCKAAKTGYLTHFERISILHVFAHVGQEGKEFVHKIMEFTMNYNYQVTERFIQRCPEKPVSCPKLRENYKTISAELGCGCTFKQRARCYPSPVLHAITKPMDVSEDVTLPVSETLTRQKEERVLEEVNIHKNAQAIAMRILEQKKQRRAIDKAIGKLESQLEKIFEDSGIQELELEMGLLVRKKVGDKSEWIIEI